MKDIAIRLAQQVRDLRIGAGLTQAELAASANVTVETVARLERVLRGRPSANANPSLETLGRLSEALGVEICELLGSSHKSKARTDRLDLILQSATPEIRQSIGRVAEVLLRELAGSSKPKKPPTAPVKAKKRR